jgi:hypothetical protein
MFFIKWHCFAGPVLAAAAKKCARLLLAVTAGAVALGTVSTALATNYYDLVAQGYRWATVDGPYASPAKDDLRQILKGYSEDKELELVEQLRVYYLVPGTIVQVVQTDAASGMSQIRINGIARDLWTLSKFLSRRPVVDPYGVVETPPQSAGPPTSDSKIAKSFDTNGIMALGH